MRYLVRERIFSIKAGVRPAPARVDRDLLLLRAVVRSEGVTALVATHDPALIDIADSVLHLEDGEIRELTRPAPQTILTGKSIAVPITPPRCLWSR